MDLIDGFSKRQPCGLGDFPDMSRVKHGRRLHPDDNDEEFLWSDQASSGLTYRPAAEMKRILVSTCFLSFPSPLNM